MIKKNGVKNEKDKEYNKINMNVLCYEEVDSVKNDIERWNTYTVKFGINKMKIFLYNFYCIWLIIYVYLSIILCLPIESQIISADLLNILHIPSDPKFLLHFLEGFPYLNLSPAKIWNY